MSAYARRKSWAQRKCEDDVEKSECPKCGSHNVDIVETQSGVNIAVTNGEKNEQIPRMH